MVKLFALLSIFMVSSIVHGAPSKVERTYTNPIISGNYADPWVFSFNGAFYLVPTMPDGGVSIFKSNTLDDFKNAKPVKLWTPPNPAAWAPEMHRIDGEWYVYTALQDGNEDADRRMHVLKGSDPNDPTKPFEDIGVITTPDKNYAIDGTVLQYKGKNYFIWSGKESRELGTVQYLYIAEMDKPNSVIGERVTIHSPYWPDGSRKQWQWSPSSTDYGVNEGPEVLVHGDDVFLTYSACGSWDACYSLGLMKLTGENPLDPNAWWAKDDGPVFYQSNATVGTGHASFPQDAAGNPYIVFHAWDKSDPSGWGSRKVFAQAFEWNEDGTPKFPSPAAIGAELPGSVGF